MYMHQLKIYTRNTVPSSLNKFKKRQKDIEDQDFRPTLVTSMDPSRQEKLPLFRVTHFTLPKTHDKK